ncbi:probable phospholipid-transporting ATPase IF isoform X1 [Anopheles albimanus]|uniref:probable phospholipid-transporting ATPase IF isoform X1 n=1 Tax=Anopheles albimanus TaxID=7167 RepID=UPI00163F36B3|nr:probable phospholipid-transporting ATPase IF isoform X1 [Anopheles albimanus]
MTAQAAGGCEEESEEAGLRPRPSWRHLCCNWLLCRCSKGNRVSQDGDTMTVPVGGSNDNKTKNANHVKSTRYSLLTFLPLNLIEQFLRPANAYFLTMSLISLVIDSPVSPLTSLMPLTFVVVLTAAKQGYEDFLRYLTDRVVNRSPVAVVRDGQRIEIESQHIRLGDIVELARDCDIPCDLVLLLSSDPTGRCYVTTANLDGETNLKTMAVPRGLPKLPVTDLHRLGTVEYERPNTNLYSFNGRIDLANGAGGAGNATVVPLSAENVLLRGSRIKNTEWAIGCAIYTGPHTKLALNSKTRRKKISSSERYINRYLVFYLILLLAMVLVSFFLKRYNDRYRQEHNVYLGEIVSNYQVAQFLQDLFAYLVLYNYLIPISLYVTIEMAKFLGGFFMEWDRTQYDEDTDQPFLVNTSDINEELGQVQILFSDKTGTLTKNEMIFQQCSVNGRRYEQVGRRLRPLGRQKEQLLKELPSEVYVFFEALAICHTVQVANACPADTEEDVPGDADDGPECLIGQFDLGANYHDESATQAPQATTTTTARLAVVRESPNSTDVSFASLSNPSEATLCEPPKQEQKEAKPQLDISSSSVIGTSSSSAMELKRAFSAMEEDRSEVSVGKGHRRTVSHIPVSVNRPTSYQLAVTGPVTVSASNSLRRHRSTTSRTSLRESYAAPAYNERTRIERQESMAQRSLPSDSYVCKYDYQASSPDEKALVEACARVGLIYTGDADERLTITLDSATVDQQNAAANKSVRFERLAVLEFTSDRKRMSVIVADRSGQKWLYTKGAESHVLPLCVASQLIPTTQRHVDAFAACGLRTLAVARRRLTDAEYEEFRVELNEASSSLVDRASKIEACQRRIESRMELLGATAVEDALQDDVRATLESLGAAGIKVWVLTGDKVETALNIALSCGHIPESAHRYFLVDCSTREQVEAHLEAVAIEMLQHRDEPFALLIDGNSLAVALESVAERFRDVTLRCSAVLCCRLSPLQKCKVVQLIKTAKGRPITAAIGDGANDVSMIQEAHVGLGIVGREGRQAAACADYAMAKFCMLKRLLFVHGHYCSARLTTLVQYFFYKNLVFMGIQLMFQVHSMFSTQSVFDSVFLTLYNVVYTAVPVLITAISEQPYPASTLMQRPELYQKVAGSKQYGWKAFLGWTLEGIYHFLVVFYFNYAIWYINAAIYVNWPGLSSFACFGTSLMTHIVILVNLKLLFATHYKTYLFISSVVLSILVYFLTTYIYNLLHISYDGSLLNVFNYLLSSLTFWLLTLVVLPTGLLPELVQLALQAIGIKFGSILPGAQKYRKRLFVRRSKDEEQMTEL